LVWSQLKSLGRQFDFAAPQDVAGGSVWEKTFKVSPIIENDWPISEIKEAKDSLRTVDRRALHGKDLGPEVMNFLGGIRMESGTCGSVT
jgi:hypothetical protein